MTTDPHDAPDPMFRTLVLVLMLLAATYVGADLLRGWVPDGPRDCANPYTRRVDPACVGAP